MLFIWTMFMCVELMAADVVDKNHSTANIPTKEIAKDTKEAMDKIINQKTARDFREVIEDNIKALDDLIQDIQKSDDPKKIRKAVYETIKEITISYEELADRAPEIEKNLKGQVANWGNLIDKSTEAITTLQKEKDVLREEMSSLPKPDDPGWDPEETDLIETKRQGLNQMIGYVEMEMQLWNRLVATQGRIIQTVNKSNKVIKKFISVLSVNARVYRRALRVFETEQALQMVLDTVPDIGKIESLTDQLIRSWSDLTRLVESLMLDIEKLETLEAKPPA